MPRVVPGDCRRAPLEEADREESGVGACVEGTVREKRVVRKREREGEGGSVNICCWVAVNIDCNVY